MAPIPRREETLARPRSRKGGNRASVTHGQMRPVTVPAPDPNWHPAATQLFEAAGRSGQQDWYQDSDWAVLWSLCEDLSHYKLASRRSGQLAATIYGAMASLGLTEGDRRKMHIELQRMVEHEDDASVVAIADYKSALGLSD